ncbi:MAG: DUF6088 family protein [Balneolaceae bacterium]|nr:DUF6088 family protein [Balneolaceae bacterium]
MSSIKDQIHEKLKSSGKGTIFFPDDIMELGSNEAIRQALVRLEKDGVLERLAHGIYLYPEKDPQLGTLHPSIDRIARAIANRDKAKILPAGTLALNKLGLTSQVPMNAVVLNRRFPEKHSGRQPKD